MSDSYTPFGLAQVTPVVNPDGTIGWKFLGGVALPEGSNPLFSTPKADAATEWNATPAVTDPAGYPPELIAGGAGTLAMIASFIAGRALESAVSMLAQDNVSQKFSKFTVNGDGSITIAASPGPGTTQTKKLIDGNEVSSWLQLAGDANLKVQAGSNLAVPFAAGVQGGQVNLPSPWPNAHKAFIANVIAGPAWPTAVFGGQAAALDHGLAWANIGTAGNYVVNWVSFGN